MKYTIAAFGGIGTMILAMNGFAADLPRWTENTMCSRDSDVSACSLFERGAREQVSGPWSTIPNNIQLICLKEVSELGQPSYRLLHSCLRHELFKEHQKARAARSVQGTENEPTN